ncbi:putative ABC transporter ATP-binding protein [compost metagenome]
MLNLRNLSKRFASGGETLPLFEGLDLRLSPGETCLLLGQSGCGKSTLLNLIAGLIPPDEGEIWLGETRLDTQSPDERARLRGRHFGIVYQDFNLLPTLTVLENLCLPLEINHLPRDMARLDALLERLGMSHKRHAWPEQLSGGQRQRVALARALVHQPKWLLADEPTGSLDEHNAEQVMGLMMAAVRDTGAGLLLVSHNPGYGALADRVLRLEGGQLLEARPHE